MSTLIKNKKNSSHEFSDGILAWILYSKVNGSILKATLNKPDKTHMYSNPKAYTWGTFIISQRILDNIFKYSVTKSGVEKTINRYFVS